MIRAGLLLLALPALAGFMEASAIWAQEAAQVEVTLQEVNGSGASGNATLTSVDGATSVTVIAAGLRPDHPHVTYIADGTGCASGELDGTFADLSPINADGEGSGTATSTVPLALRELADGGHVLVIQASKDITTPVDPPTIVVCGVIPAARGVSPTATPQPPMQTAILPSTGAGDDARSSPPVWPSLAIAALGLALGVHAIRGLARRR